MFPEDQGPAETAISLTDQFVDAGLAKLDARFGPGYAQANPQALAAYIAACASHVNSFMMAATAAYEESAFDEALANFEDSFQPVPEPAPAPKTKGRRR
ncbi:MAG: hypothetical protein U1E34_03000 [Amaricoccus sp.]